MGTRTINKSGYSIPAVLRWDGVCSLMLPLRVVTTIHGSSPLDPLFAFLSYALIQAESVFYKIPGSHVIARYVKSSHQNDPGRTVLEILLALFAIRTLLQSRTRADNAEKHFIQFSEKVCPLIFFSPTCVQPDDTGDRRARR